MLEILPSNFYELHEAFLEESNMKPEERFEQVSGMIFTVDDLIRFFCITLADSLEFEQPTLLANNKEYPHKVACERARIDDRLDRLANALVKCGVSEDVIQQFVWVKRHEMLQSAEQLNSDIAGMNSDLASIED